MYRHFKPFFLGVLLLCFISSSASIWRTKAPVVINGLVYDAILSYVQYGSNLENLEIRINFLLACAERGSYSKYEGVGTFYRIEKVYSGNPNNNASQSSQFSTRLTCNDNSGLILNKYVQCFPTYYNNEIQVLLFTGNNDENIEINFRNINSSALFTLGMGEFHPIDYLDSYKMSEDREIQKKYNNMTDAQVDAYFSQYSVFKNFEPTFSNNIDNSEFPNNQSLKQLLQNNTEFNFKLGKDIYFDILRFRMTSYDYNADKIKTFLKDYDGNYYQYANNEFSISKKIEACVNILREAIKKINWGDIYYKDYEITLGKYDFQNKLFTLLERDFRDDYFSTKKLFGESSMFYSSKGLHIYWGNWGSFSDLAIPEYQAENLISKIGNNSRKIKYRIYFLLQPISCFDVNENFEGITAYGLKAVLFKNCIDDELTTIPNNFITQIQNIDVRRCYSNALSFLNTVNTKGNNKYTIENSLYLKGSEVSNIAYWSQSHSENCETGYFTLNGEIKKETSEQSLITFYIQTNYSYVMQPGYEVKFSNTNTGATYPLVVKNLLRMGGMDGRASTLQIYIKVTKKTLEEMLNARINDIQIQISGAPKYQWTGNPLYNEDETIKSRVNVLGAHFAGPETINNFLKKGL